MDRHSEAPRLWGTFGAPHNVAPDAAASDIVLQGDWRPGEVHTVEHPLGKVVLYGDCLADEATVARTVDKALATQDPRALTHLPGSYTTLVFQPDSLTVLGDLVNQYPLYYRQEPGGGLVFGSTSESLRQQMAAPALDTTAAAARLAVPLPTALLDGRSATAGINRLDGGAMLVADNAGNVTTAPYEHFEAPTAGSFEEAAQTLRQALLESASLRAQAGYALSADFSGGLDSTTAAYLLARHMSDPLLIGMAHTEGIPSEDLAQVRKLLALPESQGLFDPHIYTRTKNIFEDVLDAPATDEPDIGVIGHAKDWPYNNHLRSKGGEVHITGSAADGLFHLDPQHYLGGLARPGTYRQFVAASIEAGRLGLAAPTTIMREALHYRKATAANDLHLLAKVLRGEQTPAVLRHRDRIFGGEAAPRWLTPQARRDLVALALDRADEIAAGDTFDYGNYIANASLQEMGLNRHAASQRVATIGLRRRAIYMDNAVVRACMSIPSHIRVNPWAFKALLAKATEGLVPPEVTSRSTKGSYTPQALRGIRSAHGVLQGLLDDSRLVDMGIVDADAVRHTLDRIPMTTQPPWLSLEQFVAHELWLRQQTGIDTPRRSPVPLQPAPKEESPPLASTDIYGMADEAFITTTATGAAALHAGKGTYHRLNTASLQIVQALQQGGTAGAALDILQATHPQVPAAHIRQATAREIHNLVRQGILAPGSTSFAIAQGDAAEQKVSSVMTRQNQEQSPVRLRDYPAALGGFAVALALKKLPFGKRMRIIQHVHNKWSWRDTDTQEATHMLAAVQRLSASYLGRAACLEATMGTVAASALQGKKVNLALAVSADADGFHAWPEVRGTPIRTARDEEITGFYNVLLRV